MLNLHEDIKAFATFKRHSAEYLKRLAESGKPLVLTINGEAKVVVQDAQSYQRLFELAARLELATTTAERVFAERAYQNSVLEDLDAEEKELVAAGVLRLPTMELPENFWDLPRPAVSEENALAAILAEQDED